MINNDKNKYDYVSTYADDGVSNINHTGGGEYDLSFRESFDGNNGDYYLTLNEGLNNVHLGDGEHEIKFNSSFNEVQIGYGTTKIDIDKNIDNKIQTHGDLEIERFQGNNNDVEFVNITSDLEVYGDDNSLKGNNILGRVFYVHGDYNNFELANNKNISRVGVWGNHNSLKARMVDSELSIDGDYNHIEVDNPIITDNCDFSIKGNNNELIGENVGNLNLSGNSNDIQYSFLGSGSYKGNLNKIKFESGSNLGVEGSRNEIQFGNLRDSQFSSGFLSVTGEYNIIKGKYNSGPTSLVGNQNNVQIETVNGSFSVRGAENFLKLGTSYNYVQINGYHNTFQFGKMNDGDLSITGDNSIVKGGDISEKMYAEGRSLNIQVGNVKYFENTLIGGNNVFQFRNGTGKISALGDKNFIIGNNGDLQISANGSDQVIKLGNGKHIITSVIGNSKIVTGDDNDSISFLGSGNIINAGNGNNKILGDYQGSNAQIVTGNGNDQIHIIGSNNVVTSGKGHDQIFADFGDFNNIGHNKYILDQAFTSISTYTEINNFDAKQGDVLDLKKSLANTTFGSTAKDFTSLKNYVSVTSQGSDVNIGISQYGDNHFTTLATLHNQNTPVTLDSLVTQGAISYS